MLLQNDKKVALDDFEKTASEVNQVKILNFHFFMEIASIDRRFLTICKIWATYITFGLAQCMSFSD